MPETPDFHGGQRPLLEWLAALSWLSYFPYACDGVAGRGDRLAEAGLEERLFLSCSGVDCSLLVPVATGGAAVLVFRGTAGIRQWIYNVDAVPRSWSGSGRAHAGFARALTVVWPHLEPRIRQLADAGYQICFTGHSLGGALATLAAASWKDDNTKAATATFGAPHSGNSEFADAFDSPERAPLWRVSLGGDPVPGLPAPVGSVPRLRYAHVGTPVELRGKSTAHPGNRLTLRQWRAAFESKDPPAFLADHAPSAYAEAVAK